MATEKDNTQKTVTIETVESVFDKKLQDHKAKEQEAQKATELTDFVTEIKDTVKDLEQADADNKETIEALHASVSEKEAELEKAGEAMATLQQTLEETQGKLEAAVSEITEAKEREQLSSRIQTLAEKELLRSSEETQIKQVSKIKDMSEEDYSAYVEDLEDIKNQTLAAFTKEEEKSTDEDKSSDEENSEPSELEKVADKLTEEVAGDSSDEDAAAARNVIKELLHQATKKEEKATAETEDTNEEGDESSKSGVSPNFESAATARPVAAATGASRFAALSKIKLRG